jgi:hypothetical protein
LAFAPAAVTGSATVCAYPAGAGIETGAAVAPAASVTTGTDVSMAAGAAAAVGVTTGVVDDVALPPQPAITVALTMTQAPIQ